ncbi:AMP-binding protein [Dysgonomonas sp. ZJ279]|uniref:AMP-binding protein n=1 Tax=Dysgonomonas sp. ZJ279 TaxID=2709796 RepID=UPI002106F715|nr:AMP-binding protein [Dysgonomonas sp. ZJ279]
MTSCNMYQLERQKQTITIEGKTYYPQEFNKGKESALAKQSEFHHDLYLFLQDWFSDSPHLKVQTSGSTGTPKEMLVEKEKMMQSAKLTCTFLGLQKNDTALLCMSLNYIAGKMLVVRALIAELNLYPIAPSGNPLRDIDMHLKFAAMIPLQVYNSLQDSIEAERLSQIDNLIIGGGAIDNQLQELLKPLPNKIYSTYGMTETLSHIALRRINGNEASEYYSPFSSVNISLSEDNALIINAPLVSNERLYTNDIAKIHKDGSFQIIGRKDNIINSGGIKIQIEEVENLLKPVIDCPFAITSIPDPKFGEAIVLVIESAIDEKLVAKALPPYYLPKKTIIIKAIPLTETGKISRQELKQLVEIKIKEEIKREE